MTIYTLEIDGVPIAAYGDVASQEDAASYFNWFLQDLAGYQSPDTPGVPIYSEGQSETHVRVSAEDEVEHWRRTLAQSVAANELGEEDRLSIFLKSLQVFDDMNDNEAPPR